MVTSNTKEKSKAENVKTGKIPSEEYIRALPKVDLHCHLDGSLRARTLWELVKERDVRVPLKTPEALEEFFRVDKPFSSLEEYLKRFDYVLPVLQDAEALQRVAYELAIDAAAEGILYMEVRYSPVLHTKRGLELTSVMDAVLDGLRQAEKEVDIVTGVIVCGIRNISPDTSLRLAELAAAYKHQGVVGFDLAGSEDQFPAKDHSEAFYLIRKNNINCTVHAGEAYGPDSIRQALHDLNTHRIGHGTRLKEDGDLLNYVNDHRIPLEICITSNVHVGAVKSLETHPLRLYYDYGLRVTLNTDNRLISNTTITDEYLLACRTFGFNEHDLKNFIVMGFKSSFMPYKAKVKLLERVLKILRKQKTPF
ncbi:adenosine deaminase [candidate division LCP-89 bacterium B3_LCP]|uniref:adenosine deaminase n=1 Tax=candidate division LCP-89 bacterium B3_LCP TaxID=2012998 RepID=A0A532V231_UNCL8|nr:MAG: adenosine deaminase [candidate division LCP-89 bacterium B3_LCP]